MPRTWAEVPEKIGGQCPGPFFALDEKATLDVKGHRFVVEGSTMRRDGGWDGPLVLGVLGAVKDAEDGTRKNVKKAAKAFAKQGVHFVLANGDLAESNEVRAVFSMLGEELSVPVLLHSGNIEWTSAFTEAWVESQATHPHLVNLNWIRHVVLGDVHLVSLPGWSVKRYVKDGACFYDEDDVAALRPLLDAIKAEGGTVVLTAHGPPKSFGAAAIDTADLPDGRQNVGDEALAGLVVDADVRFGIFSHILEAGGRATSDLKGGKALPLPTRAPVDRLYLNVGSASAFPWRMNDGSTSKGLAAVVALKDGKAKANILRLWQ